MKKWTHRGAILGLGSVAVIGGCAGYRAVGSDESDMLPPPNAKPTSVRLSDTLTVHLIQTGWVAVKRPHRAFGGPDALALPAIIASGAWTSWLPVTATAITRSSWTQARLLGSQNRTTRSATVRTASFILATCASSFGRRTRSGRS